MADLDRYRTRLSAALLVQRIVAAFCAVMLAMSASVAWGEEYRLGPMDKLQIRVVEWQSAEGMARDWSTISGEYTVSPSGMLSLPFLGELPAEGRTTAEIADTVATALQQKFGLFDLPAASVEISEFRPIFVAGDVETPGKYPFEPGLTVLKAISVAGGLHRAEEANERFARDYFDARGNYDVLLAERDRLMVKLARLEAEAQGAEVIELPEPLRERREEISAILAGETDIMETRSKRLALQLKAQEDLKTLLQSEIVALEQKIETQQHQMELTQTERAGIDDLADRGLVVNSRVLTLERMLADLQGQMLDLQTASLRAKQDISEADQEATDLRNDRSAEIAQQHQETQAALDEVTLKLEMYANLMQEAVAGAPVLASAASEEPPVTFSIVRSEDGESVEVAADENTPVKPGDVVKVELDLTTAIQ